MSGKDVLVLTGVNRHKGRFENDWLFNPPECSIIWTLTSWTSRKIKEECTFGKTLQ